MADRKKANDGTVAVRISPELRKKAKVYAARADMSLTAVLSEAIEEYLKRKGGA